MLKIFKNPANAHMEARTALRRTLNLFCLKMVSRWPKMSQDGLRWSQDGQDGLRWPKMAQDGPEVA